MKLVKNEKVIDIMQKTLNHVDKRLMNHGSRVGWMMYKMLKLENKFDNAQLRDICVLAMLHDIGAYKTEEIDRMVIFESVDVWEHSIYGYLFLKYFSPLRELSPAILFHHADCREAAHLDPYHEELAQMISLSDRADVFLHTAKDFSGFQRFIEKDRDVKFHSAIVDLFFSAGINIGTLKEDFHNDKDFHSVLYNTPMQAEEADDFIKMTIFSIDFRSSQTVIHTIAAACISRTLAGLSGFGEDEIEKISTGAMLHDIGKTGVPIGILESPRRLTPDEMEIMKTHVTMTEDIITGNVDDDIKEIAVRHHEKLNNTGYPRQVGADAISPDDRIMIIADIFSALCGVRSYKDVYSKDKIVNILTGMSADGLIDSEIVSLSIDNYSSIIEELDKVCRPVIAAYDKLNEEYARILAHVKQGNFDALGTF